VVERLNRRCKARIVEERSHLQPLPQHHFVDYREVTVRVTRSSTIEVNRVLYSVPSRLVGERLRVHIYHDRLDCYLGHQQIVILPRIYPLPGKTRARCIDYRHVIVSLSAKPQAFRLSQIRDELLPTAHYRQLWLFVNQCMPAREACKWIVGVLRFAYDYDCEERLAEELLQDMNRDQLPSLQQVQDRFLPGQQIPAVQTVQHPLNAYDQLLTPSGQEVSYG
jgi:hypothetical protein